MRLVVPLCLILCLSACFTAGKRGAEQSLVTYDLGPKFPGERLQRQQPMALEVSMPLWFDAMGIGYRLAYRDVARLHEYARARWVGPPAQLIQQQLSHQLDLVPHGQGRTRCVLRIDIREFSQHFVTPVTSYAVLQGRMQWLDRRRSRLAERPIDLQYLAPSPDARGGVAAFSHAMAQWVVDIQQWESELVISGQLKACDG